MAAEWDAEKGVWVGDVAAGDAFECEEPYLYIFGYGSLVWRPGDLMEQFPSYFAEAFGYKRLFAQRSMDHRGTPSFPGVVATLVSDDDLETLDLRPPSGGGSGRSPPLSTSSSIGKVYMVEKEAMDALIVELDFREKGGYTRHWIEIELLQDTPYHTAGSTARALVYTGSAMNPNFFLPKMTAAEVESTLSESVSTGGRREGIVLGGEIHMPDLPLDARRVGEIIAAAVGPSGTNAEYLYQLCDYFHREGYLSRDRHLHWLQEFVRRRRGAQGGAGAYPVQCVTGITTGAQRILGWGSNEYGQLQQAEGPEGVFADMVTTPVDVGGPLDPSILKGLRQPPILLAGGSHGGLLIGGTLRLWGSDGEGRTAGGQPISGVRCAALGHSHTVFIDARGALRALGNNSHGQSSPPLHITTTPEEWVAVSAGLRHSAALARSGRLIFWGCNKHGQAPAVAPSGSLTFNAVSVACGARHSVWIDAQGALWTSGDNTYGQRGSATANDSAPSRVDVSTGAASLAHVRWCTVDAGWSHSVARGVDLAGRVVVVGWGRNSFGQLGDKTAETLCVPTPLPTLPGGLILDEVWSGSEFTAAADSTGAVFMRGWNEHHNTACDDIEAPEQGWVPVHDSCGAHVQLKHYPWKGSLALGGGHCLALV